MVTGELHPDRGAICTPVQGKDSKTRFEIVKREFRQNISGWVTVVDLWPCTGRKHQLRVHLASIGHPIIGDELYQHGLSIQKSLVFDAWLSRGLYLWAVEISFEHPITGAEMHYLIDAPEKFENPIGRKCRNSSSKNSSSMDSGPQNEAGPPRTVEVHPKDGVSSMPNSAGL
jgi:23S rRNA pseudouridine1911/1915/1917 synthase